MQAIIFAYDVTRRETFESLSNIWLNEVNEFSTVQSAIKMVVANKVDRDSEREVSRQEGAAFARQHGCLFVETSAKFNTAVTQVRLRGQAVLHVWLCTCRLCWLRLAFHRQANSALRPL
jgi:GTPase SAR1 family protein